MLNILGLGAGDLKQLTLEGYQVLKEADILLLRTEKHPIIGDLKKEEIFFESFDRYYEEANTFGEVYAAIVRKVLDILKQNPGKKVVYAVPGHPLVAEDAVQKIIEKLSKREYKIIAGPSFIDAMLSALAIDPIRGLKILDGLTLTVRELNPDVNTIISQIYNRDVASQVKLILMEIYSDDIRIKVLQNAGMQEERVEEIYLYELDRLDWVDHLTSIFIPEDRENNKSFERLLEIMNILRSKEGCPWDLEQTHFTLKKHLIEEAYEVLERIEEEDIYGLANELGDLLLQIVFHSQIAKETGVFSIYDVISEINEKMIRRHPHIFGNKKVSNAMDVLKNWEEIKKEEKVKEGKIFKSILSDIPIQLPALLQSQKLQAKAAKVGFDWEKIDGAIDKVEEEILELKEGIVKGDAIDIQEEFGDLLFSLVNVARFLGLDAENALRLTINKFKNRFAFMEERTLKNKKNIEELSLGELEELWSESKEL